jgi:hypothetical protein
LNPTGPAASAIVDEAPDAGLDGSHLVTVHAKVLWLELLKVKADLERELGQLVLGCSDCGRTVHWVPGLGVQSGHWHTRTVAWRACQPVGRAAVRATWAQAARDALGGSQTA